MQDMQENPLSAQEIIAFRNKSNLSRAGLARKLGLTPQAIEKWERGIVKIPGGWRYALFNIANGMRPAYDHDHLLTMLRRGEDWPYEFHYRHGSSWDDWLKQVEEIDALGRTHGMSFWKEGSKQQFPNTLRRFDFLDYVARSVG